MKHGKKNYPFAVHNRKSPEENRRRVGKSPEFIGCCTLSLSFGQLCGHYRNG